MKFVRWLVAIGTAAVVCCLVLGCSASQEKSSSSGALAADSAAPVAGPEGAAATANADSSAGQTTSFAVDAADAPPAEVGRQVVSTANVTLHADDLAAAKQKAAAAVEAAGGFVYAEQGQYGDHPSVSITLKVPPDRFRSVLADLGDLGDVESQQISTDDVTDQVIDLDSRIASAQASVDRVRGFLDRANTVLEISTFENELLTRETDLEKLRGQKRSLDGRVDSATIVLAIQPPPPVVAPATEQPSTLPGFVDGLAAGWRAFVNAGTVVLVVLGALLPFAPLAAVVVFAAVWWRRRAKPAESVA